MLSGHDRRRLAEIERGLEADDPALARRFVEWRAPQRRRDPEILVLLLVAFSMLGLVVGMARLDVALIVSFGIVIVAALTWLFRTLPRRVG